MWAKAFGVIAAVSGCLSVCFGAFGAHALKASLSDTSLSTWQTAVQYQFYHIVPLLFLSVYLKTNSSGLINSAGILFCLGIVFFSGSLYWLALGGPKWLGPVTPLGGLCLIVAWLLLAVQLARV